jgi:hypothetical protein
MRTITDLEQSDIQDTMAATVRMCETMREYLSTASLFLSSTGMPKTSEANVYLKNAQCFLDDLHISVLRMLWSLRNNEDLEVAEQIKNIKDSKETRTKVLC